MSWGWKELTALSRSGFHPLPEAFRSQLSVLRVRQDQPGLHWDQISSANNTRWDGTTGIWRKTPNSGIYKPKGRFLICNHSVLFTALQQGASPCRNHTESPHPTCLPLMLYCRGWTCSVWDAQWIQRKIKVAAALDFRTEALQCFILLMKSFLLPSNLALTDPWRQAQTHTNVKSLSLITLYKCHTGRRGSLSLFTSYCLELDIRVRLKSTTRSESFSNT